MEMRECKTHGVQKHYVRKDKGLFRCSKCSCEQVSRRRRKVKATLVAEHGGMCKLCGYNRYIGSLDFHHIDPSTKSFGISNEGLTRSLERSRVEAAKCVLLCRNCHGEVESGITFLSGEIGSRA